MSCPSSSSARLVIPIVLGRCKKGPSWAGSAKSSDGARCQLTLAVTELSPTRSSGDRVSQLNSHTRRRRAWVLQGFGCTPVTGFFFLVNEAFLPRDCCFELQTEERDQLKNERHLLRGERGAYAAVPQSQHVEFGSVVLGEMSSD